MLTRVVLAAISVAAVAAAGGSTTVLVSGASSERGLAQRSPRAAEAQQAGQSGAQADGVQAAEVQLPPCPADVKNHGAYVSSVAKANRGHAEEGDEAEGAHGALVSAAAQSDCGKPAGGAGDGDAAKTPEEKAAAKAEKAAAKAARQAARERGKSAQSQGTPGEASTTP